MNTFGYGFDKVLGMYVPGKYPGESSDNWEIPPEISKYVSMLNSIVVMKYTREYLKICAFYNKMFPSLKTQTWTRSTYNTTSFTAIEQERSDTGTGISSNYLKQIIDQTVSRLGTISFEPMLIADMPTLEYVIYKDETERLLRKRIRDAMLNRMVTECFHDAAVVGYSHIMINPVTHDFFKVNDYELGIFEAQMNDCDIKQCLYRNWAYPVTSLAPYLVDLDEDVRLKIITEYGTKVTVDFKMYFDCTEHKYYIMIGNMVLPAREYPFGNVQLCTFAWDIGFTKVTSTSMFDLLYPIQRELNKVNNKIQQLIRMYKGAVPVFPNDVDLAMKSITNGSGEALYVDSTRPIDQMITVINPTPMDPQLVATKTELKTEMYELAGLQQMSLDMENFRSAAAVIAMDQTRDTVFQAQVDGIASFVKQLFKLYVSYNATINKEEQSINWGRVNNLVNNAEIELKPIHVNDPTGNKAVVEQPINYQEIQIALMTQNVLEGRLTYGTIPFSVNKVMLLQSVAQLIVKLNALSIDVPDSLYQFMVDAFIVAVQQGAIII